MVSGNWETDLRKVHVMPTHTGKSGRRESNVNSRPRAPKPDYFCPWGVEEDIERVENDIELWASQRKKDVATFTRFGEVRPRKGREWELYICIPQHSCSNIPDFDQFKHDSLIDELKRPKTPPAKEKKTEVIDTKKVQKPGTTNGTSRKPPPSLQNGGNIVKPRPQVRSLAQRRNTRPIVDEDEDDVTITRTDVKFPTTISDNSRIHQNGVEQSTFQNAKITQRAGGEPSSVKLCYTQGAVKQKEKRNDEQKRIQEMRRLNEVKTRYVKFEKTADLCNMIKMEHSQNTSQKESKPDRKDSPKSSELSKPTLKETQSRRASKADQDISKVEFTELKPVTLVLRKLSNASNARRSPTFDDDRERKSRQPTRPSSALQDAARPVTEESSVLQRDFQEFRMGSLLNAMSTTTTVVNKVTPTADGIPNSEPNGYRGYQSRGLVATEKHNSRKRDSAAEIESNLVNQIAEIIQLREVNDLQDKFVRPAPLGPPGFRPVAVRSPLQRARDNSTRRKHGSVDFDDRRKGLPPTPKATKERTRSAHTRSSSRPEQGVT